MVAQFLTRIAYENFQERSTCLGVLECPLFQIDNNRSIKCSWNMRAKSQFTDHVIVNISAEFARNIRFEKTKRELFKVDDKRDKESIRRVFVLNAWKGL
jgi:hypothetical protein